MRISIREQLAGVILLASLLGLAVLSIAVWSTNHAFVLMVARERLQTTATLKAAQIASTLELMQTSASFVTTRVLIQQALTRYNNGSNMTTDNWTVAQTDLEAALTSLSSVDTSLVLQAQIFPSNTSGPTGAESVLNATGRSSNPILLPYTSTNGSQIYLGDPDRGYPPALYPNLTVSLEPYNRTNNIAVASFGQDRIDLGSALVLGPLFLNETQSLLSLTLPIVDISTGQLVLGWLTAVMDARLILQVIDAPEGLGSTGQVLLIGPLNATNRFPPGIMYNSNNYSGPPIADFDVRFLIPLNTSTSTRHPGHTVGSLNEPFPAAQYPAVYRVTTEDNQAIDNAGSLLATHNEANRSISAGFAIAPSDIVDWIVIVEQGRGEVWQPIDRLRDIILACVFSVVGFLAISCFPMAHVFVMPIRRLKRASEQTIEPPRPTESRPSFGSYNSEQEDATPADDADLPSDAALARKEGFYQNAITRWRTRWQARPAEEQDKEKDGYFRIPGKVKERDHWVQDELSDLTKTFNEMSDELFAQYEKLEDRVRQRTIELEHSKKAAEAANESKTLFIANISHELKTPLNGILGMCAVCMQEDDPLKLKRSLGIIYKSGDLLLNLLTDLLTFSKNQVGQVLTLDEKEFRIRDISSQILAIFEKQANESSIDLRVEFEGLVGGGTDPSYAEGKDYGPPGTGRLKDMILWGDPHRILQVVINLVSNSLKFTPAGGAVVLTIRCLAELPPVRKSSLASRQSKQSKQSRAPRASHKGSESSLAGVKTDTANVINAHDRPKAISAVHERSSSPPPGRDLYFEFAVQDTGPGIPEDLQQRIFEPFVQGDVGLSKKHGGTGLGLSICSQLAGLMLGGITVSSTVGQGSTFTMKIPIRHLLSRADSNASSIVDVPSMAARQTPGDEGIVTPSRISSRTPDKRGQSGPSESSLQPESNMELQPRLVGLSQPYFASTANPADTSPGLSTTRSAAASAIKKAKEETKDKGNSRIRVLVAEDNKVNQEVVLRMLKLEDIYDVTVAKDGQEALDCVKATMTDGPSSPLPYNLIFMDVQMPNMDGLTSTKLIRECGFNKPIVALTAFAEESNIQDCYGSGMNYFLAKPIRRPQLKKVLTEYCPPIEEEDEEDEETGGQEQKTTVIPTGGTDLQPSEVGHRDGSAVTNGVPNGVDSGETADS